MELVHGGDWMGYRERFGRDALDFSANVSPLGLPEGVAQAIRDALPLADRYPDPLCRTLRAALSRAEGVPQERILCGNGAADLIFRLVWAVKPHKALVTAPTFAEYASALDTVGCEVKRFFLDETNDFAPTDALVDAVDESIDMVFLCQPNNPTGQLASPELVKKLLRQCGECRTILAVDECFLDFLPDADGWTAKPLLESGNIVILKAFTKLYGMAGVRLGYCLCGDETLLEKNADSGPAVGRIQSGPGGRRRGPERNRLCGRGARPHRPAAARSDGGPAGAGSAGHRRKGELSALPRTRRPEREASPSGNTGA